jgi:hypothetical protein
LDGAQHDRPHGAGSPVPVFQGGAPDPGHQLVQANMVADAVAPLLATAPFFLSERSTFDFNFISLFTGKLNIQTLKTIAE